MATYKPTQGMKDAASRALEWRKEYGRGGTSVGVARARDISNGSELSEDTVERMFSFFSRHETNKSKHYSAKETDGGPTAWRIAWDLWGGNAGFSWSRQITERLKDERSFQEVVESDMIDVESEVTDMADEQRAEPDGLSVGDYVEWNSSGGQAYGRVDRIERDGEINVPDADATANGNADDPAALIEVYREGEDGWEASGVMVGHRFSTLTKVQERADQVEAERFSRDDMKTRSMDAETDVVNEERRTARIAISSEVPVGRSFGDEILDHSETSIDLEFARSGRMP